MVAITGSVRAGIEVAEAAAAERQARAPRARRQGARDRVRRRRPRGGRRGHRRGRLLQRRSGLHGGHPGAGARVGARRLRRGPRRGGQGPAHGHAGRPGRRVRPGEQRRCSSSGSPGFLDRLPDHASIVAGGHRVGDAGLLRRAHGRRRPAAGRRDRAGRDLRSGDHRAALHRRGRGDRAGQRRASTGSSSSVWTQNHGRALRMSRALDFGVRLDQHAHPARRGDAARRLQAVRATARTCRCTGSRTTPGSST